MPDGRSVAQASASALRRALPVAVIRGGASRVAGSAPRWYPSGCVVLEAAEAVRRQPGAQPGLRRACADQCRSRRHGGAGAARLPGGALADMPWVIQKPCTQAGRSGRGVDAPHRGAGLPEGTAPELREELRFSRGICFLELAALWTSTKAPGRCSGCHGVHEVPCADPGVLRGVDAVDDLSLARPGPRSRGRLHIGRVGVRIDYPLRARRCAAAGATCRRRRRRAPAARVRARSTT